MSSGATNFFRDDEALGRSGVIRRVPGVGGRWRHRVYLLLRASAMLGALALGSGRPLISLRDCMNIRSRLLVDSLSIPIVGLTNNFFLMLVGLGSSPSLLSHSSLRRLVLAFVRGDAMSPVICLKYRKHLSQYLSCTFDNFLEPHRFVNLSFQFKHFEDFYPRWDFINSHFCLYQRSFNVY